MNDSKISFFSAVLISVNVMVGAGIYLSPPQMAAAAGNLSYLGWFASLLLFLPVVLSISKLAAYYPGEGGVYSYTKRTLGSFAGFITGWAYFIGFVGAQSLQTFALRSNIAALGTTYPFSEYSWFVNVCEIFKSSPWVFNAAFLMIMLFLCSFSLQAIARFQKYITAVKLFPLVFVIALLVVLPILGLGSAPEAAASSEPALSLWESLAQIWKVIPFAIFGYWGFEASCNISHRIAGSKKNASRVILFSFFIVGTIYTLFHLQLLRTMGPTALAQNKVEGFMKAAGLLGPSTLIFGSLIFTSCLAVSYFNAIFSELLSYSFTLQMLAKQKQTFCANTVAKLNKNSQPIYAIFVNCVLTFILTTFIPDEAELVAITNIGVICSFLVCLIALFKLSKEKKDSVYLIIGTFALCSCAVVSYYSSKMIHEFNDILPFASLIIFGIIMYFVSKGKGRSSES